MRSARILVGVAGVFALVSPVAAQSMLTADRAVDAPVVAPALLDQQMAAIAYGAGEYLAVWRDGSLATDLWAIRAARLGRDGESLDTPPLPISTNVGKYRNPAVAFDGKNFLVIWDSIRAAEGLGVFGAYVTPQGAVGARFNLTTELDGQPSVTGGDGYALVTWQESFTSHDIHAKLLDDNGAVVKDTFALSDTNNSFAGGPATAPTAVWGGPTANNFLVAWSEGGGPFRSIEASTVSASGVVSVIGDPTSAGINTSQDGYEQAVARVGDGYFLTWVDNRDGALVQSLYGISVAADGTLGSEFRVARPAQSLPNGGYTRPQALGAGNHALIIWESLDGASSGYQLLGGRVSVDGSERLDGDGALVSSAAPWLAPLFPSGVDSRRAALASDGTVALAVWTHISTGITGSDVLTLPIDPSPSPSPSPTPSPSPGPLAAAGSKLLSRGANFEIARAIASDGKVVLYVWEDDRNALSSGADILGLRTDLEGAPIDAAPFVISNAPGDQFQPSVAVHPGGDFLVAWADGRNLTSGGDVDIYATRVGAAGAPRDPQGIAVSRGLKMQIFPTVAAKNDGWLVAWEDWRSVTDNNPGVWLATVAANGTVGGEAALVNPVDTAHQTCAPAAAWNGSHFFVAYEQPCHSLRGVPYVTPPPPADLFGRWLSPAGTPSGDTVVVAALAGAESAPRLAAVGDKLVLVWRDQTAGDFIRAARLADNATGLEGPPVVVASGAGSREAPAVAATSGVVLFSWIESSPPGARALVADAALTALGSKIEVSSSATLVAELPTVSPEVRGANAAATLRTTPPAPVAAAATGEAHIAYDLVEQLAGTAVSRVHYRKLALLGRGAACSSAGGCADGICSAGVCCDEPCDGVCQACGKNGCVETPASDARCGSDGGILSCGALSTDCRQYADLPLARCAAFGQCAEPGTLAECTQFTDAPDGSECDSAACEGVGACSAGGCVCLLSTDLGFQPRGLPVASGCSVGGGGSGGAWLVMLLLVAIALRRRALLLILLAGCDSTGTALSLTLRLDDPVFFSAARVRVVLTPADATPVRPSMRHTVAPGIEVSNFDVDGDGALDVVIDLLESYPLTKLNKFEVVPPSLKADASVNVRCEVIDHLGNTFARLGGPARTLAEQRVPAVVQPNKVSAAVELRPACIAACPDATLRLEAADATVALATPPTAMALGNLTGAAPAHMDLIVSSAHLDQGPEFPNAGQVSGWFGGGATFSESPNFVIQKLEGGAQLGAALASGNLDGDGRDELVIGAPGAANTRGVVYVLFGRASWPATLNLASESELAVVTGLNVGERMGTAVAVGDIDFVGTRGLVIGAPGADQVYVVMGLKRGQRVAATDFGGMGGPAGSQFGRAVAVNLGNIAVGAPLENGMGAVHWFSGGGENPVVAGQGGGFGSALALLIGGLPRPIGGPGASPVTAGDQLAVSAPLAGSVFVLTLGASSLDGAGSLRRSSSEMGMGASLARLRWPEGDALVIGAPAGTENRGQALVVRSATVEIVKKLQLDPEGRPAAALLLGERAGDALGGLIGIGDLDGDGWEDMAAASSRGVHIVRGPIL